MEIDEDIKDAFRYVVHSARRFGKSYTTLSITMDLLDRYSKYVYLKRKQQRNRKACGVIL